MTYCKHLKLKGTVVVHDAHWHQEKVIHRLHRCNSCFLLEFGNFLLDEPTKPLI